MKEILKRIAGKKNLERVRYLKLWRAIIKNFYRDFMLYCKYSTVFTQDDIENIEAIIILDYHAIEKGLLHDEMKPAFAKDRIQRLHVYLQMQQVIDILHQNSQILVAYQVMCTYYEMHEDRNIEISSFYTKALYITYKKLLKDVYSSEFKGVIDYSKQEFYKNNELPFEQFAYSRKSVRHFTGEKVPLDVLNKAIALSTTSPSVCNRQATKVYLIDDKSYVDKALEIQEGFRGFIENVSQLLIITNDRKFYYTIGERNQFYIDGGIFFMNLLYSLHYYKIGNCPANWGKDIEAEKKLSQIIDIPESEKIICMLPIGLVRDEFKVTLSKRREPSEILKILKFNKK